MQIRETYATAPALQGADSIRCCPVRGQNFTSSSRERNRTYDCFACCLAAPKTRQLKYLPCLGRGFGSILDDFERNYHWPPAEERSSPR